MEERLIVEEMEEVVGVILVVEEPLVEILVGVKVAVLTPVEEILEEVLLAE